MMTCTTWDAGTISAVAALFVSFIALLITTAQALQQYFITGQLIRLCDSVVYGPLPGRGHRVWQTSQFRFRVIYSMPSISIARDLWPSTAGHVQSYAAGSYPFPDISKKYDWESIMYGEDSSGAFSRKSAHDVFKIGTWISLWNRLPTWTPKFSESSKMDIRNIPHNEYIGEAAWASFCRAVNVHCGESMRVDFRTYDADRCPTDLTTVPMKVSMRDIVIIGLMTGMEVTYCSFKEKTVAMQGEIGTITAAQHPVLGSILHFTPQNVDMSRLLAFRYPRRDIRGEISYLWMARTWDVCSIASYLYDTGKRRTIRRLCYRWLQDRKEKGGHSVAGMESIHSQNHGQTEGENVDTPSSRENWHPLRRSRDGNWVIRTPSATVKRKRPSFEGVAGSSKNNQAQRMEKKNTTETWKRKHENGKEERGNHHEAIYRIASLAQIDMFWCCQIDVFQGFWATTWLSEEHIPHRSSFAGAVAIILEALQGYLPGRALVYVQRSPTQDPLITETMQSFEETVMEWLYEGLSTCPAYALNAAGGVIATGTYRGVCVPSFCNDDGDNEDEFTFIPALELLYCYRFQVQPEAHRKTFCEELNLELMRIDSWLSFVGRLPAIANGPNQLIQHTPVLVDLLQEEFWVEFQCIDYSFQGGDKQAIQSLTGKVKDWMAKEKLTEAEQLYILVACLRGYKVGQCILAGVDTSGLQDILLKDVQVHMV